LVPGQAGDGRLTAEPGVPQPNEVIRLQIRRLRIRTPLGTLVSYNPILFVRCLGEAASVPSLGRLPDYCSLQLLAFHQLDRVGGLRLALQRPGVTSWLASCYRRSLRWNADQLRPIFCGSKYVDRAGVEPGYTTPINKSNRDRCGKGRRTGRGGYGYNISMSC